MADPLPMSSPIPPSTLPSTPGDGPPPLRSRGGRVVGLVLTLALGLVALELGLRALERATGAGASGPALLLRPSQHPDLAYEPVPGAAGRAWGGEVRFGAQGFRARELPQKSPSRRVVVLGDGAAFGAGLEGDPHGAAAFPAKLGERLASAEVLNFALPGYDVLDHVARLESAGLAHRPDVVLLALSVDDLGVHDSERDGVEPAPDGLRVLRALESAPDPDDDAAFELAHEGRITPVAGDEKLERLATNLRRYLEGAELEGEPFLAWFASDARLGRLRYCLERLARRGREAGFEPRVVLVPYVNRERHAQAWYIAARIVEHECARAGIAFLDPYADVVRAGMGPIAATAEPSKLTAATHTRLAHLIGAWLEPRESARRAVEATTGSPLGRPPHILVLMADDLGYADVGYTTGAIETPHIDRLAARGVRLERLYGEPICSPARAAFFTGRYPHRYGLGGENVSVWSREPLPLVERLFPELLREVGYRTAITGKWHLGLRAVEELPQARGFDVQYGHYSGMIRYESKMWQDLVFDWFRQGEVALEPEYATDLIAAEAARIVREHDPAQPLFLFVSFNAPHGPYDEPPRHVERNAHHWDPCYARYAAIVACLDDGVGEVLKALAESELEDDTLVLFLSDNGGVAQEGFLGNLPYRDGKFRAYEGGVRVPAVVAWPGVLPEGERTEAAMHLVDLCATFLRLAGVPREDWPALDGIDQWPHLFEGRTVEEREIPIALGSSIEALIRGNHKLVRRGNRLELYDLATDATELHDLSTHRPAIHRELVTRMTELHREVVPHPGWLPISERTGVPPTWAPEPRATGDDDEGGN